MNFKSFPKDHKDRLFAKSKVDIQFLKLLKENFRLATV